MFFFPGQKLQSKTVSQQKKEHYPSQGTQK
jgi:hypothetical protein